MQHKTHEPECKIFSEKKVPYPPSETYPVYIVYKVIEILRGVILKYDNPDMWEKILDLQYKTELGDKTELFKDLSKLRKVFGIENVGTEKDWRRVLGVLNVNNFSMEGPRGTDGPS